jgi:hypothetical protein
MANGEWRMANGEWRITGVVPNATWFWRNSASRPMMRAEISCPCRTVRVVPLQMSAESSWNGADIGRFREIFQISPDSATGMA